MRLLIDTHILLWFLEGNQLLATSRHQIIADPENDIFVSIGSLWEMAIKISLNKLTLSYPLAEIVDHITSENINILPILPAHAIEISVLPFHHRDPFDRLLVAQSRIERLALMSNDKNFKSYEIEIL